MSNAGQMAMGSRLALLNLCAALAFLVGCASAPRPTDAARSACADPHWTGSCPPEISTHANSPRRRASVGLHRPRGIDNAPFLPWPPPKPTRIGDISSGFAIGGNFGQLDRQIRVKLVRHGYEEMRYFAVPGGFGVTTNLERLDSNGRPSTDRWLIGKAGGWTSLFSYLSSLVTGESAQFRLFAILVTNEDLRPAAFPVTQTDTERWKLSGMPYLSASRARLLVGPGTKIWLLVYEFAPGRSKGTTIVADEDGRFPFSVHARSLGLP